MLSGNVFIHNNIAINVLRETLGANQWQVFTVFIFTIRRRLLFTMIKIIDDLNLELVFLSGMLTIGDNLLHVSFDAAINFLSLKSEILEVTFVRTGYCLGLDHFSFKLYLIKPSKGGFQKGC